MKKIILPLIVGLAGLAIGGGAGWMLRPAPTEAAIPDAAAATFDFALGDLQTIRMPNHFVVPILVEGRVESIVVMSVALELTSDHSFSMARHEARLRSIFLQTMFDHSNVGGFHGVYTSGEALHALRRALRDAARAEIGTSVHDVLITEILRQES